MAEEAKGKSAIDAAFESVAGGIETLISPHHDENYKKSLLGKVGELMNLEEWVDYVGEWGISRALFVTGLFIPLVIAAHILFPPFFVLVWGWLFLLLPVIGTVGFIIGFAAAWIWYVQSYYIFHRTNPVLLEVKMPAEVMKSPRAMEQVLTGFWIRAAETTFIDRTWHGGARPYFSLEIASFGGEIHFYIWTRKSFKNVAEASMYAQYPEVEIVEVEDYASRFQYDPKKYQGFGTDYIFVSNHIKEGDERLNAYSIRTYVDFELDKDPKEEFKVDPFAQVLETLSALNKDEQAWIQIVFRSHLEKYWAQLVEKEIEMIREKAAEQISLSENGEKKFGFPHPTEQQKEQMRSMARHLGKLPFEFCGRGIYIAPRGKMRSAEYTSVRWIFRPFANPNFMVMLRPRRGHNVWDYEWQGWHSIRWEKEIRRDFDRDRRRQVFHPPWQTPYNITSVETLATIWHPPSRTIQAPGLQRIPAAKAAPPPNLPV